MPAYSYRVFLLMDQLRRRAGISVPQLLHVVNISISNYSRISEKVYAKRKGVLHYAIEREVFKGLFVLRTAYAIGSISATTMKRPNSIIDILKEIERTVPLKKEVDVLDHGMSTLLHEAVNVLNL